MPKSVSVRKNKKRSVIKQKTKKSIGGASPSFSFDGMSANQWVNGLLPPAILVGARELFQNRKLKKTLKKHVGGASFSFDGMNANQWITGLGTPLVLVGAREFLDYSKGKKKTKHQGGSTLAINGSAGNIVTGLGTPVVLVGLRELIQLTDKKSKKNLKGGKRKTIQKGGV